MPFDIDCSTGWRRGPLTAQGQLPLQVLAAAIVKVGLSNIYSHAQVIRSNDVMYKAGQTEMVILRKLSGADPAGKRHCVRMLRSFEYRQHLCLVFESMVRASPSITAFRILVSGALCS